MWSVDLKVTFDQTARKGKTISQIKMCRSRSNRKKSAFSKWESHVELGSFHHFVFRRYSSNKASAPHIALYMSLRLVIMWQRLAGNRVLNSFFPMISLQYGRGL